MKHLFATFLCALSILLVPALASAGFDSNSAVEVVIGGADSTSHGSGVYIGNNYILTAGHVAKDQTTLTIKRPGDGGWTDVWEADVVWVDAVHDMALLRVKAFLPDSFHAAKVECTKPAVGDNVSIVGWPRDLGRIISRGYIAGDDAPRGPWKNSYIVVAPVTFGNSGGPIFDNDGAVIGLAVGILDGTSLSIMAPVEPICAQLPK